MVSSRDQFTPRRRRSATGTRRHNFPTFYGHDSTSSSNPRVPWDTVPNYDIRRSTALHLVARNCDGTAVNRSVCREFCSCHILAWKTTCLDWVVNVHIARTLVFKTPCSCCRTGGWQARLLSFVLFFSLFVHSTGKVSYNRPYALLSTVCAKLVLYSDLSASCAWKKCVLTDKTYFSNLQKLALSW